MGKHFDSLVDVVKKSQGTIDNKSQDLIQKAIRKSALFEFPLDPKDLFPNSGKDKDEYDKYIDDYLDLSEEYDKFLIMPYDVMAIEDVSSVAIMESIGFNRYRVLDCQHEPTELRGRREDSTLVTLTEISIDRVDREKNNGQCYSCGVSLNTAIVAFDGEIDVPYQEQILRTNRTDLMEGAYKAALAFIEEVVYIMDPDNFIIRTESNQSIKQSQKSQKGKKRGGLKKTIMRPYYKVFGEDDLKDMIKEESKTPRAAHPVRGHWRHLTSEKWKNKKGQRIFIKQYFTGDGEIEGRNGWNYQIMIKEDPTTLKPYRSNSSSND